MDYLNSTEAHKEAITAHIKNTIGYMHNEAALVEAVTKCTDTSTAHT